MLEDISTTAEASHTLATEVHHQVQTIEDMMSGHAPTTDEHGVRIARNGLNESSSALIILDETVFMEGHQRPETTPHLLRKALDIHRRLLSQESAGSESSRREAVDDSVGSWPA